jgi:protein polybromo-1
MWRGCSRIRKGVPPFPKMERLLRHVREIHIVKNQGRIVSPNDRNKYITFFNFYAKASLFNCLMHFYF